MRSAIASQVSGVEVTRLPNKIVVAVQTDGPVVPVVQYDQDSRTMAVTVDGGSLAGKFTQPEMPKGADLRQWLKDVKFEQSNDKVKMSVVLGPSADPLDFLVNSSYDGFTAVLYTGKSGEAPFAEKAPSEKIVPQDMSESAGGEKGQAKPAAVSIKYSGKGHKAAKAHKAGKARVKPAPAAPETPIPQLEPPAYTGEPLSERVQFSVDNMPLNQAISTLIGSTNYNAIIDESVMTTPVTLTFRDVTIREALDLLTRTYGLMYVLKANTIIIGSKENIDKNFLGTITRSFVLDYADGDAVKTVLIETNLVSKENVTVYNGEIQYQTVSGSTTIGAGSTTEISTGDIREMKSNMSTARRNIVVVTATEEAMAKVEAVIRDLDKKPKMVKLEAKILEIDESKLRDLGLTLNDLTNTVQTVIAEQPPVDIPPVTTVPAFKFGRFRRSPVQLTTALHTLISNGNARILAQPNLTCVDGRQAIYFSGQSIPYITSPAQSQGTTFTPAVVAFKVVGITLSFKPRVDRDNLITMEVNPIVSSLIDFIDVGGGAKAPETQSRQVTTTIRIADGDTFGLGGLISDEERRSLSKLPLLGEVPFFGKLFQSPNVTHQRTEIIVIVTAKVED
jgi:type II secretory pathway component GspD/PulD (secretin)